jgi:hypothetical protein
MRAMTYLAHLSLILGGASGQPERLRVSSRWSQITGKRAINLSVHPERAPESPVERLVAPPSGCKLIDSLTGGLRCAGPAAIIYQPLGLISTANSLISGASCDNRTIRSYLKPIFSSKRIELWLSELVTATTRFRPSFWPAYDSTAEADSNA